MMLLISSLALAAPDRVAAEIADAKGAELRMLEADGDTSYAALRDGGTVYVVDLDTWEATSVSVCSGSGLALWAHSGTPTFAAGCDSGAVDHADSSDGWTVSSAELFSTTVLDLEYGGSDLWVLTTNDTGGNPLSWQVDASAWTTGEAGNTLVNSGDPDHVVAAGSLVYVANGSNSVSKIDTSTGSVSDDGVNNPPAGSYVDIATYSSSSSILLTDSSGGQLVRLASTTYSNLISDLAEPSCSVIGSDGSYVGVATSDAVTLYNWDAGNFTTDQTELGSIDTTGYSIERMLSFGEYVLAATDSGLLVLTDVEWVEITSDHSAAVAGDTTLSFVSDTDGTYTVSLEDGTELSSGDATADDEVEVDIAVSDLSEGVNRVFVDVGFGYDATDITVDTPTPAATLSAVTGGDGVLYLDMAAHGASDIDSLEVFISTESFTSDDVGGMTAIVLVDGVDTAEESGWTFTVDADANNAALANGVTYYVGARWVAGVDAGDVSEVLSGTPVPSDFVLCDMRADGECPTCSTTPGGALALLGVLGLAALAVRRPRFAAILVAAGALAPSIAQAQETGSSQIPSTSAIDDPMDYYLLNKQRTTEVRFGPSSIDAPQFGVAYDRLITVHVDGGVQLARFVELNGGVGLTRPVGSSLLDDGSASGEVSRMNIFPISGGVTFRLDPAVRLGENSRYLDHDWYGMPVVPYFSAGITAWPTVERKGAFSPTDPLATSTRTGAVPGTWYWAAGVDILLDWMDPKRAAQAEARWGIADTYLTIEYRKGAELWGPGIDFGGDAVTAGIKVDRH